MSCRVRIYAPIDGVASEGIGYKLNSAKRYTWVDPEGVSTRCVDIYIDDYDQIDITCEIASGYEFSQWVYNADGSIGYGYNPDISFIPFGDYSNLQVRLEVTGGGPEPEEPSSIDLDIGADQIIPVMIYPPSSGSYSIYTEGSRDTYGYLSGGNVSTTTRDSNGKLCPTQYNDSNDDGGSGNNFKLDVNLLNQTYKVWVRYYSTSVSGSTTLRIDPPLPTFYGSMVSSGKNSASIYAKFENGQSDYSNYRYIRVKLNGSWVTVDGYSYYPAQESMGATSTFSVSKTGLAAGTTYSYEIHLYYKSGSTYYDTGYFASGSFTTDQDASGMMIYHNGWKNAIPYIYTNGAWHRCSSRIYHNGWKTS